jgi:molecular chaperone HtpG
MERYFRAGPSEEMRSLRATRILELNPSHHAFTALKDAYDAGDKEKAADFAKILCSEAELVSGVELEDAGAFVELVSQLF